MTVAQLIDYLQQFDGKARVFLDEPHDHPYQGDYIALSILDFDTEAPDAPTSKE